MTAALLLLVVSVLLVGFTFAILLTALLVAAGRETPQ